MRKLIFWFVGKYGKNKEEACCLVRYLVVGAWNTIFGIGIYALLYELFHPYISYFVLIIPANILAITNAYIGYKFIVFKTKGHYFREYFRFYIVYGGSIVFGFVLMCLLVSVFNLHPILAQCVCIFIPIICSYIGHKNFSFKDKKFIVT
jgi:putative flippase GtrA